MIVKYITKSFMCHRDYMTASMLCAYHSNNKPAILWIETLFYDD